MSAQGSTPADRPDAGFTLVEFLVALTLLGVIMSYFSGAFLTVQRANALTERVEDNAVADAVAAHLRRMLEGAVPVLGSDGGERYILAFMGSADRIRFVAQSDGRLDVGGLVSVEILLDAEAEGSKGTALWEVRQVFRPSGGEGPAGRRHLLLEDVGALAFRYYGAEAPMEPPDWRDVWARLDALPLMVEVSFATRHDDGLKTHSFSVAPPAAR